MSDEAICHKDEEFDETGKVIVSVDRIARPAPTQEELIDLRDRVRAISKLNASTNAAAFVDGLHAVARAVLLFSGLDTVEEFVEPPVQTIRKLKPDGTDDE